MAPDFFHQFMKLPPELRREIYLLATPARVVHIKEHEEYHSSFIMRHYKRAQQLKLDPSLSHFACNWRGHIPVANNKSELPMPCPIWLEQHLDMAWNFARDGYLYSQAPIPVFLHTCRCDWDFSQFHPADMERVRRVALAQPGEHGYFAFVEQDIRLNCFEGLNEVARLFGNLDEMLLVEWTGKSLRQMRDADHRYLKEYLPGQNKYDTRNLSTCAELREIDVLLRDFPPPSCPPLPPPMWHAPSNQCPPPLRIARATGTFPDLPDELKQEGLSSLENVQAALENRLTEKREQAISADDSVSEWKIPKVQSVHLLTLLEYQLVERERSGALERFHEKRRIWASEIALKRIVTRGYYSICADYSEATTCSQRVWLEKEVSPW
ncbi:hypothetical protein F53441_13527 [Fusarium austroafricanum]|uniref:2EXR domain-containing protein n=1 Tax=Fusarium austroafricanum TaxID=2364996 RepID=A0A8H4NF59_9HYPO|nr:hypothetical protein F53441_13527 [Fusarium austroafricanum]